MGQRQGVIDTPERRLVSEHIDPVCGMSVDPESAAANQDYNGQTYYFCSASCVEKFRQAPQKYVGEPTRDVHRDPYADGRHAGECGGVERHEGRFTTSAASPVRSGPRGASGVSEPTATHGKRPGGSIG